MASGFMVIISAPSGTGKSTVVRKLRERDPSLVYSISVSTRRRRPSEVAGRHYRFVPEAEFRSLIRKGEFLEWAKVHGNLYGTPKRFIDRQMKAGSVVLMDVDVKGADAIRRRRKDAVTVFLLPPSWEALEERLQGRSDTADSMHTRLANAREEIKHAKNYDYWVVNDSLPEAVKQVEAIITAERLKAERRSPELLETAGLTL